MTQLTPTIQPSSIQPAPRRRLWTIDALRGAAAIGVVVYHARDVAGMSETMSLSRWLAEGAFWGQYGVWLFFVVSGFCIHLRWVSRARTGDVALPNFWTFWRDRWRRLYPPYLVALGAYVLLHYLAGTPFTSRFVTTIGLHVLLIHNLDPAALNAINGVFWTLAIEEQLYLLYFVLLRVRIRWGWTAAIGMAALGRLGWFALAALVHRIANVDIIVTHSAMAQWFVWTMGAVSVEMYFGMIKAPRLTQSGAVAALALAVAGFTNWTYLYWMEAGPLRHVAWLATDYLWGLAFFAVVNATVRLESRASTFGRRLAAVGFFSYSLYLSHEIVTHGAWPALWRWLPGIGELPAVVLLPLMLVACIGFAWVFFICFERPFLNRRPLPAAALTPQPQAGG